MLVNIGENEKPTSLQQGKAGGCQQHDPEYGSSALPKSVKEIDGYRVKQE